MTLTHRGRRVVAALALVGATTVGLTAQHWNPYTRQLDACRTYDVPEDVDGTGNPRASALLAAGWYGDPADHAERLYAPSCR